MTGADLSGARMKSVEIKRADGSGTGRLWPANLSGAIASRARCAGTDFRGANMRKADFSGALLAGAMLDDADTEGARLGDAPR
jgi:uncharacterized protein YjbI with pentapeptide repeats